MEQQRNSDELTPLPLAKNNELKNELPSSKTEHGSRNLRNFDPFYVKHDDSLGEQAPVRSHLEPQDNSITGKFATINDPVITTGNVTKESYTWIVYSVISGLSLVGFTLYLFNTNKIGETTESRLPKLDESRSKQKIRSEINSQSYALSSDTQLKAKNLFEKFVRAKSSAEIKNFVWNSSGNSALIDKNWHPIGLENEWILSKDATLHVDYIESNYLIDLTDKLPDGNMLWTCFRFDEQRQLKLDWKATTGYCSADFSDLVKGEGDASEIRTHIIPYNFYTHAYPEDRYRSFKLVSPSGEHKVDGYAPIGSEIEKSLIEIFTADKITSIKHSRFPVLVELEKSSPDSLPSQWMIKKLYGKSWIEP